MKRCAPVFGLLLAAILFAGAAGAKPDGLQQMWWNDSRTVDDLDLSKAQRKQMDTAYQRYRVTIERARREVVGQGPYLEALEAGNWKTAEQASNEWLVALQVSVRAMVDLKLAVLPVLTAEQRAIVLEKHPRLIRRNWNRPGR